MLKLFKINNIIILDAISFIYAMSSMQRPVVFPKAIKNLPPSACFLIIFLTFISEL